ncbi:hypothetical protein AGMMS49982_06020 [Bacteroidia bacterium]|nr:hypothetical protein AGMMS49982_06020 [Bacteroidia bacterium]
MKNRIKQIMDSGGFTPATFAAHIDVNPQTMTATMKRNENASTPILQAILKKYKNINAEWLMLGEGTMYKNDTRQTQLFPDEATPTAPTQRPQAPEQPKEPAERGMEKPAEQPIEQTSAKVTETIKYQEIIKEKLVVKKATRVIVYYADNTFDSFAPE